MLEPLTALSLASSILQVIDFGGDVVKLTREIYKSSSGSTETVTKLDDSLQSFNALAAKLQREASGQEEPLTQQQAAARDLAARCTALAGRFTSTCEDLQSKGDPSKRQSIKIAVKIKMKQSTLEKYQRDLSGLRADVMAHILGTIGEILRHTAELDVI